MGNVCCCGCWCCRRSSESKTKRKSQSSQKGQINIKPDDKETRQTKDISPQFQTNYKTDDDESDREESGVVNLSGIEKLAKNSVRGGNTSYAALRLKDMECLEERTSDESEKRLDMVKGFCEKMNCKYLDVLGSGCYADVYKVSVNNKNKELALKIIDGRKVNDHYSKFFLKNEILFLKKISKKRHKNIIRTYEILTIGNDKQTKSAMQSNNKLGKIVILMELAPNGTMADMLRKYGSLTEDKAHPLFVQILDGVQWLHGLMIAHRDLKLENILLSAKFNPKISDFSFTTEVDPKNPLSDQFCGTVPYLSPEILGQIPYNPMPSDIWALGVCFFIMLNDGLPFSVKDEVAMYDKQRNRAFKHRKQVEPNLSPELKSMIASMLEPDVKLRLDVQQLMNHKWTKKITY